MARRSSSIDVFLRLHGQRKFAKEVEASGAELEAMGLKGSEAIARFSRKADSLKKFGRSWSRNVTLPMVALGVVSGKMASEFDSQASLISAQAGGSAREVGMLKGQVQELAKESEFGPTELMKSLFFIESAGLRGSNAMKMLRANVKLATAGASDLEHTTFGMVGAMNALGKEGKNFNRLAAIMNATVGHGHMRQEELVGAISTGLVGTAKSFGVSWGGMGSAIAFFTKMAEPAQQAGTRLRQTITHLATSASTKGAEALESIGMSTAKMGANIRKTGRLGPVIKELTEHLNKVSKTRASQVLTEAFGGGKFGTQVREATKRVGLLLRTEREIGKEGTAKTLGRHYRERLEQPAVKLKMAWSSVQVALIKLGNEVLPLAVPGLERLAGAAGHLTDAFTALPGPVQASVVGFLLLTGPVASGLGYFASGVGRALVLTMKLASAGKDLQVFTSALRAGQGLSGAASMAFSGTGIAGALQTAKGFALSLGPAVAAYGIGNIVTSALSGDWKEAGFEAGGALAGGIAGFMLGGPLGAMLGVGVGSLGGELLSGLFGSNDKVSRLQSKLASSAKGVKAALEGERTASKSLAAASSGLVKAQHRRGAAAHEVKSAEHALAQIRDRYGPNSLQAIKAEVHLAKAGERRAAAIRAVKRAERLKGQERSIAKEQFRYADLELRHQIRLLRARKGHLSHRRRAMQEEGASLQELHPVNERLQKIIEKLTGAQKSQSELFQHAAKQVGPRYASFLRTASGRAIELGSNLKAVRSEIRQTTTSLEELGRAAANASSPFQAGIYQGQANKLRQGLPGLRRRQHHLQGRHGGHGHPKRQPRRGLIAPAGPGRLQPLLPGDGQRLFRIEVENVNTLHLDGKEVASNVTGHVSHDAARE